MNILVVIIIVAIVAGLMITIKMMQTPSGSVPEFESRVKLFTPAEMSFLGVLDQALDSRYRVFGKVRLGDLVKPAKDLAFDKRTTELNRINQKHVDFVVCTANELALVGVLELDDQSYGRLGRAGRDGYVDQVLAMAGIPLIRFPAKNGYAVQEVRERLAEMISSTAKSGVVSVEQKVCAPSNPVLEAIMESTPVQPDTIAPACPKCSAAMVKRQAVRGQNTGRYFWACSTFPMCIQVVEII
jgi:hypothetical protein